MHSLLHAHPPGGASVILGLAGMCLVLCVPSGVVRALCRLGGLCSWAQQAALGAGVPASALLDASPSALTWVPPLPRWPGSGFALRVKRMGSSRRGWAGQWLQTAGAQAPAEGAAAQPARRAFFSSPFLSPYFLTFLVCAVRGPLSISCLKTSQHLHRFAC